MSLPLSEGEQQDLLKQQQALMLESAQLIVQLETLLWRQARLAARLADRGYPEQFAHEVLETARDLAKQGAVVPPLSEWEARLGNPQ